MSSSTRHIQAKVGLDDAQRMPAWWQETLGTLAAVGVGLIALAFVLIVLPWVISI